MFIQKNNNYTFIDGGGESLHQKLEAGVYGIEISRSMFSGTSYHFNTLDTYKNGKILREGVYKEVWEKIDNFVSDEAKEVRKEMKLPNRLGLLLNGLPGTGKTFLAGQIGEYLAKEHDAITLISSKLIDENVGKIIDIARQDSNRLIIVVLDEFEKGFKRNMEFDSDILEFLDGPSNRENVIFIGTCNDTTVLPETITSRPGRFEKIFQFTTASPEVAKVILHGILPDKYKDKVDVDSLIREINNEKNITIDIIRVRLRDRIVESISKKT